MAQLNSGLPTAMPPDAISLEAPALPTAMPADAIPLEQPAAPSQSALPTTMPPDAMPLEVPHDAAPVETSSPVSNLLKAVTGAMFGNNAEQGTPLGPVIMNDAGEFYKGQDGKLYAFAPGDFVAPDPKTGSLMAFSRTLPNTILGKARDIASAVVPGLGAPELGVGKAVTTTLEAANEAGTAAKAPELAATAAAPAAEAAPAGMAGPAAETAASAAPAAAPELQARINGLMAGDKQIMTPEQLSLLQDSSAAETAGAAAKLPGEATQPIVKEGLSRNIVGAFQDMLEAGKVTMVPGIKPTDQVLALMRSDILPPETYNAILKKWGVDPVEVVQSAMGEGMRESSKLAGQTLQQLSQLQQAMNSILKLRAAAGETGPEIDKFLASQTDDVGNNIRSAAGQIRGIWQGTLVGQLATSMRNAITAVGTVGVDTLARGLDAGLQSIFVNPARRVMGMTPLTDPIDAFANFNMLLRSGGRVVGLGDKAVTPYAITKAITDALPDAREALFGRYASDVNRATGGAGVLGRIKQASDFLNFHGRFQEFVFRRAFFAAELTRRLDARGLDLDSIIKAGQLGRIPQEDIAGAANEALRLTYGRPLGNSGFDQWMRAFNQFQTVAGRNPFPPIPFVRFMADAMKWQFEHSPFGAVRLLSKTERAALGPGGSMKVASRALAGSAMFYAAYMLRNSEMGGSNWYSVKIPGTDHYADVRAFSPLSNYLFVADLAKRAIDNTLQGIDGKQIAQGLIGANFRAGVGLYLVDDLINNLAGQGGAASKAKQIVETWAGDTLAGFVTPLETFRDFIAQGLDREQRIVRDQRQSPVLAPAMSRIPYVDKMLPPLASPTRAGPLEEPAPAVKQLLGVTVQEKQNAAEGELARLGIQRREVLPSSGDPRYDRAMATLMGPVVEKVIGRIVTGPKYQAMDNPTKAEVLSKSLGYIRDAATKAIPSIDAAMALQQQYARMGVRDRIFLENLWAKLPPDRRTKLQNLLIR